MPFTEIRIPEDGAGKRLATRTAAGLGPGATDVHLEVDVVHPENSVGHGFHSQSLVEIPSALTVVLAVSIALQHLTLHNKSGSNRTITITDGNDLELMGTVMNSGAFWNFPMGGIALSAGLKWGASGADVFGAFTGYKATE